MFSRYRREASTPRSDSSSAEKHGFISNAPHLSTRKIGAALHRRTIVVAVVLICVALLALALGLGLGLGLPSKSSPGAKGPNVLVIMTDDQDMLLDSMSAMPYVSSQIGGQGVTFEKHYCTVAWCCPSRVNFLTGRAAHNTNVTSTGPPYGGWQKFTEQGLNEKYLPVWIKQAGIQTYYIGKLLNGFSKKNMATPKPPQGWTDSSMLTDPWTYNYYHGHWTNSDFTSVNAYNGIHTTNVTQTKALAMLDKALASKDQWFMMVAPVAPHQEIAGGVHAPPVPAEFAETFANRTAPRTGNWNPDEPSGASWVYNLPKLSQKGIDNIDLVFNHRLGNLAAIDAMVSELMQKLDDHGVLDNTYVIYTTDNGFHMGNHRLIPGKRCPYEEDINIPLLIRGPNVPKGQTSSITNSHTDMAPTILQMLGVPLQDDFDGAPIAYTDNAISSSTKQEIVNVEFWNSGTFTPLGLAKGQYYNNTYKALRLMSDTSSFYYSTWCTGEREFYDMVTDQYQMQNWLGPAPPNTTVPTYFDRPQTELISRLDALLMVTKSCTADSCRNPWMTLFPSGVVSTIEDAMNSQYDTFFTNQPKIAFASCTDGNIITEEGPQKVNAFSGSTSG